MSQVDKSGMKSFLRILILVALLSSCSPARTIPTTTPIILMPTPPPVTEALSPTQTPTQTAPTLPPQLPTETLSPTPTATSIPIDIVEVANFGNGSASVIAWSPDGKSFAIGGTLGIHIYDANSHNEISYIPKELVHDLKFSPDGQFIGVKGFEYLLLIRLSDEKTHLLPGGSSFSEMAFSPDARLFAYNQRCRERECGDTVYTLFLRK